MTENLRLELSVNQVLTSATSDVVVDTPVDTSTQPYNQSSTNYHDWGIGTQEAHTKANTDRWLSRSTKKDGVWTTETTPVLNVSDDRKRNLTGEDQKTGVYYNWYTATAGTGNWSISNYNIAAQSSICPAGWQLPRHSGSKSWAYLIRNTYSIISTQGDQSTLPDGKTDAYAKLHAFPFSLPYSGSVDNTGGATTAQGGGAYYMDSASITQTTNGFFYFNNNRVYPANSGYRTQGFSVRCVAK